MLFQVLAQLRFIALELGALFGLELVGFVILATVRRP